MANLQETPIWESGIYQLETSDPVMGGENGIDNRAPRQLANRTLWLKNELARAIDLINQNNTNLDNKKANKATQFTAGSGLTVGGDFSGNRTIALGTPSKITANSINVAVSNTHSHEIDKASPTVAGIVQLVDNLTTDDDTKALTAKQGKVLNDKIYSLSVSRLNLLVDSEYKSYTKFGNIDKYSVSQELHDGRTLTKLTVKTDIVSSPFGVAHGTQVRLTNIQGGAEYTLSMNAQATAQIVASGINYIYLMYSDSAGNFKLPNIAVTESITDRHSIKFIAPRDGSQCYLLLGVNGSFSAGEWFAFHSVKLEKGNIVTEWTPAPGDSTTVSVYDFGAVGDGVTDDAVAINKAAQFCQKRRDRTLLIVGQFYLNSSIDLRHCKIDATRSKFIVGHNGIGVILGGAGNNANNPTQQIDEVTRAAGLSASTRLAPLVQIIGAKGQYIDINRADYVQIYANAAAGSQYNDNYSSVYSTFNLKYVDTIELFGENNGWINENTFNLNRCHKIVIDGDYHHNHNLFNRGCMEGKGQIYCSGNSNQFVGFRFERTPSDNTHTLQIDFPENSWNNHIEASWLSSKYYTNNPYNTKLVTVNDKGFGNTVNHVSAKNSQDVPLFSLTPQADIATTGTGTGGVFGLSNMAGVRNLKHLPNGKYEIMRDYVVIYESPLIDLTTSPIVWFRSSEPYFRMNVYYFNEQNQRLTEKAEVGEIATFTMHWNDTEGFSFMQSNTQNSMFYIKPNKARFAKVVITAGNNVEGLIFNTFVLGTRQFYRFSKIDGFRLEMLPESKGSNQPLIYQNQEIDMDRVPEGVVCYKSDLTEMRVNIQKTPLLIKSIDGNTITLAIPKMFLERGKGELLYKSDTDDSYKRIAVTSGYNITITLTENAPADLSANSEAYFIITKVKGL